MIWNALLIAVREIARNKMRSALTTLGIVIGVGAVIAMVMLGDGASASVTQNIAALGEDLMILVPGSARHGPGGVSTTGRPFELADAEAIQNSISGLRAIAPSAARTELVVVGSENWRTLVVGTTPAYFDIQGFEAASGRMLDEADMAGGRPLCLVGSTVRRQLFGASDPVGSSVRIGNLSCMVVGALVEKAGSTLRDPNDIVIMPLKAFHRRIAGNRDVTAVNMSVAEGRDAALVSHQIELLMRERRRLAVGEPNDFNVRNMKDLLETMSGVTGVLTALLGSIAAISLIVGGIGIMNIMLVSVTERTREIGIRLAVGARGREVLLQFLIEAIVLSTLGGVVGAILGVGLGYTATRALSMAFVLSPKIIAVSLGFAVFVGVLFGLLPARKAARMTPIDALRHE